MKKPRILYWDVENTHNIVATFTMHKTNISHEAVIQDWFMLCVAWKWDGDKKIHSVSLLDDPVRFKKDHTNDYHVVKTIRDVIATADAIIAHNGDAFDIKKLNARLVYHGLDPVPNIVQIDTLKMARSKFRFTFNKLDYLGEYLGVGRKIRTDIDLWLKCLEGDEAALKKMIKYNKTDVKVLEEIYKLLAPYCPAKLNHNLFTRERVCPSCGSANMVRSKRRLTRAGYMIQMQCKECGHYSSHPESKKTGMPSGIIR